MTVTGSEGVGQVHKSWADMLSRNLPSSWNKNILEVVLEKDVKGGFVVTDVDCARLLKKIGLDQRPGIHIEQIQICPSGRGVILITLKKEVPIENFCRHDVLEVTSSGIRATNIKPAGKREVVVHVKGLHPNTRDGFSNGDRFYKMEIKPNANLGTYHKKGGGG